MKRHIAKRIFGEACEIFSVAGKFKRAFCAALLTGSKRSTNQRPPRDTESFAYAQYWS